MERCPSHVLGCTRTLPDCLTLSAGRLPGAAGAFGWSCPALVCTHVRRRGLTWHMWPPPPRVWRAAMAGALEWSMERLDEGVAGLEG